MSKSHLTNYYALYSQGIVVSVLYCFMSSDVKMALAKRYYRFKVRWQSRNLKTANTRNTFCMQVKKEKDCSNPQIGIAFQPEKYVAFMKGNNPSKDRIYEGHKSL